MLTHVRTCKQPTCTSTVHPNNETASIRVMYFTVFNAFCCICITNQCFLKLFCGRYKEKAFPGLSEDLSRHTLGPKLSLFSFLSVSLCPRVICYWSRLLNRSQCWCFPYRMTFDLFGQRDQQRLRGEQSGATPESEQSKPGTIQ